MSGKENELLNREGKCVVKKKGFENRGQVLVDGRITIPKKMRTKMKITHGMFYEVQQTGPDTVTITFFRV